MQETIEPAGENTIKNIVRVETALSRYPIHKLGKHDQGEIIIKETAANGDEYVWRVYNRPGALAYKFDTLVVNRRIDDTGRPVPDILRLGTLHEICYALDLGRNTTACKRAIEESAWTIISAKIVYTTTGGKKKKFENQFPRCKNLYFYGDVLPDGERADAVYMAFHDDYLEILNTAQTRPLDYDYLKELTPTAQRLYELLSFQMYAAFKHSLQNAKLLYSDFCKYAPQTRYFEYDQVKKQMFKIHRHHIQSSYLAKVKLEEVRTDGKKDWMMVYTPGNKARVEFLNSQQHFVLPTELDADSKPKIFPPLKPTGEKPDEKPDENPKPALWEKNAAQAESVSDGDVGELVQRLEEYGIKRARAIALVEENPEEVKKQLDALPFRKWADKNNYAGMLIDAIVKQYSSPSEYYQALAEKKTSEAEKTETKALVSNEELKDILRYCPKCYGSKMEIVPGSGARPCKHDGLIEALTQAVEDGDLTEDLLIRYQTQTGIKPAE